MRRRDQLPLSIGVVVGITLAGGLFFQSVSPDETLRPVKAAPGTRSPDANLPDGKTQNLDVATEPPRAAPTGGAFDEHFRAGALLLQSGRYSEAATLLESTLRLRPHVPEVYVNIGFARLGQGRVDHAITSFLKAVELRPRQANAYFGLAESLERKGDLPAAIGHMRTYLHLTGNNDPYRRRGMSAIWEWRSRLRGEIGTNADDLTLGGKNEGSER